MTGIGSSLTAICQSRRMTVLADITANEPRLFTEGAIRYLVWPAFWVSMDGVHLSQWVGDWSRDEIKAVVMRCGYLVT